MGITVLFRGDDVGLCVATNAGAQRGVADGVLRNLSIQANGLAVEDAARRFRGMSGVSLGLHAAINGEWARPRLRPVAAATTVATLCDADGWLRHTPADNRAAGIDPDEVRSELDAQLDRLHRLGLAIEYVDEHMGFSWIGLRDVVAAFARAHGLIDLDPRCQDVAGGGQDLWQRIDTMPEAPSGRQWRIITHPGAVGGDLDIFAQPGQGVSETAKARQADTDLLCHPELHRLVADGHLRIPTVRQALG